MAASEYKTQSKIGQGAFGACFLAKCSAPGGEDVLRVIKQIDGSRADPEAVKKAITEARIMSQLKHENIIGFIEIYKTRSGNICIVMEHADGGDLKAFLDARNHEPLPEMEVIRISTQLCLALKFLHERNILHRDIKLENVFLMRSGSVKLGDFGASKELVTPSDKARTQIGTPYYFSPELVQDEAYSFPADVWALGVLMYELCALHPPFEGRNLTLLCNSIINSETPPLPSGYSQDLSELISSILRKDPEARPTIHQILRHRVITSQLYDRLSFRRERPASPSQMIAQLPDRILEECEPEDREERRRLLEEVRQLREHFNSIRLPPGTDKALEDARKRLAGNLEMLDIKQVLLEQEGEENKVEVREPPESLETSRCDLLDNSQCDLLETHNEKAELLRRRLARALGESTFKEVYGILQSVRTGPDFCYIGPASYSDYVKHLLSVDHQTLYIPQINYLISLERGEG